MSKHVVVLPAQILQNDTVISVSTASHFPWRAATSTSLPESTVPARQLFWTASAESLRDFPERHRLTESHSKLLLSCIGRSSVISAKNVRSLWRSRSHRTALPMENSIRTGRFGITPHILDRLNVSPSKRIYELSKGEFMKLQICFSLAHHPDFLILDEPLEGFDPVFRHEFLSLLGELLDQDMGILLSTHITEDVDRLADYLLILENGRLVECAPRESLNDKYKEYTGKAAPRIRDLLDLEHTNGTRSKDR